MTPEQRARVREIQRRLDERGLQNIAFNVRAGPDCPPSHIIEDVCQALEMFLDGKVRPLPRFNDSQRAAYLKKACTCGRGMADACCHVCWPV